MNKIQKVSAYLIWAFNAILWGYPGFFLLMWIFPNNSTVIQFVKMGVLESSILTPEGLLKIADIKFTPLGWSLGVLGGLIGFLPYLLSLVLLKRIFRDYQKGSIFSYANAQRYKLIGGFFILGAVFLTPLSDMLIILSATLSNPPGHRYISLSFGTPHTMNIVIGLIILVVSWVMAESSKLQDDQALTI